jgi:apolipoprotein N-acyltransferase
MFGVSAVLGVLQAFVRAQHQDLRIVTLISMFTFAPLLFAWCKADAASRAITPPPAAPLLVGIFALVGVPYYFLKALPIRQARSAIALAAGLFLLMGVTTVVLDMVASRVFAS